MRHHLLSIAALCAVATIAAGLSGCGRRDGLPAQADDARLAIDAYGCPDLSGRYQMTVPGDQDGVRLQGSLFEQVAAGDDRISASQIKGLQIERTGPGRYRFRYVLSQDRVQQSLAVIREFEKDRYRAWYHLQEPARRAEIVAREGQAAYDARVADVAPRTQIEQDISAGVQIRCDKGWVEIPRGADSPIRMTLAEDGSLIGRSKELETTGVTVWCGDGCKQLPIPTGHRDGLLYWGRSPDLRAWQPDDIGGFAALERPMDEIEAETAARAAEQERRDTARFLPVAQIRATLAGMAPPETVVDSVQIDNGEVHIRYTAPNGQENVLLGRINGASHDPEAAMHVRRSGTSSDPMHTSIELSLNDSPLVLREAPADAASSSPASAATLFAAPDTAPTGDFADADTIRTRVGRLMPSGCRVTQVRHGQARVTVYGQAETLACISATLRAIEQAQAGAARGPELISVEATAEGGRQNFRIQLAPSALTRR